jgi:hypothetical protein
MIKEVVNSFISMVVYLKGDQCTVISVSIYKIDSHGKWISVAISDCQEQINRVAAVLRLVCRPSSRSEEI